jgi:predicted dehydrogenase
MVSIATQPSSHRDLTLQALDAGCHVLCEKPVAMNLAEAVEMVDAAERAGRLLSICFQYRYWDEAVYVRERITAGDLGHVHAIRTWGGAVRSFTVSRVPRRRETAIGGVLVHWTIHNMDLALWLLGHPEPLTASAFTYQRLAHQPPGAIVSAGEPAQPTDVDPAIEDFGVALVRLAGDTVLTVEANYLEPPSQRPEGWDLLGDRGAASIAPIRVWHDTGNEWVDRTPPAGKLAPGDYTFDRLVGGFLERVRSGGPAPVSGAEVLCIQRLIDALYRSRDLGREVAIAGPVSDERTKPR